MTYYHLILFCLATAGLVRGITKSELMRSFREKTTANYLKSKDLQKENKWLWFINEVINCDFCCGFWCGIIVFLLIVSGMEILCYPFIGSLVSLYFNSIVTNNLNKK